MLWQTMPVKWDKVASEGHIHMTASDVASDIPVKFPSVLGWVLCQEGGKARAF